MNDSSGDATSLNQTLAQAAQGDEESWRQIVLLYTDRVYGLIYRQCRDQDLAAEITQATFVQVVQRLGQYHEQGRFEPWLFRIAMNRLRDEMRRRRRQARPMDMQPQEEGRPYIQQASPELDPLDRLSQAEQIHLLGQAMNKLGDADREILHLRHTAGLSFAQIAQMLGQPLGTVLARGHRALGKLRKIMTQDKESP
jgi:RNA polymerase sigma-70 factor (ECF subfamily)